MNFSKKSARLGLVLARTPSQLCRIAVVTVITVMIASLIVQWPTVVSAHGAPIRVAPFNLNGRYPVGTPDSTEPSGEAPPSSQALVGYTPSYQNDFTGTAVPPGWEVFTGIPLFDPGGHFGISHVVVSNGLLQLNTYRDPSWGDRWVTGGICQCGVARRYGAYFVRSRVTGAGPTEVQLLWPAAIHMWPPEIDFNETGGTDASTTSSVHFGKANNVVRSKVVIDMTLWHTWGVIWTPTNILYTVDGRIWGQFRVASDISKVPMTLDFEQRQECEENRQCPTAPESMQIDWVAEYLKS